MEAFSASGLRSIRYAKEIVSYDDEAEPLVAEIVSNDISKRAVERIEFNIKQNEVGHIVKANHAGERQFFLITICLPPEFLPVLGLLTR